MLQKSQHIGERMRNKHHIGGNEANGACGREGGRGGHVRRGAGGATRPQRTRTNVSHETFAPVGIVNILTADLRKKADDDRKRQD